jgi:CheY-like chemotaxis protein
MMKVRNSISALSNGAQRSRTAGEKATLEQLTADLKREFVKLRAQVPKTGLEEQLDPVQKKVFQDEFFSITQDETYSNARCCPTDAAPRQTCGAGARHEPEAAGRSDSSFGQIQRDEVPAAGNPVLDGREPQIRTPGQVRLETPMTVQDGAPRVPENLVRGPKTVLLISADPEAPERVGQSLRPCGYELMVANAGFTGYLTAMRKRPDLILLDLSLPCGASGPDSCLDGKGVLKMLSKLPPDRALPFIGLVPNDASETEAHILTAGATACLQKPLDPRQVLGAVQLALDDLPLETDQGSRPTWTVSASI